MTAPGLSHSMQNLFSCDMQTLISSMWDLVPWPGIEPGPAALGAWSVSHWTTREVPQLLNSWVLSSFVNSLVSFWPEYWEPFQPIRLTTCISLFQSAPTQSCLGFADRCFEVFAIPCQIWDLISLTTGPQQWKTGILTTRQPGNSVASNVESWVPVSYTRAYSIKISLLYPPSAH